MCVGQFRHNISKHRSLNIMIAISRFRNTPKHATSKKIKTFKNLNQCSPFIIWIIKSLFSRLVLLRLLFLFSLLRDQYKHCFVTGSEVNKTFYPIHTEIFAPKINEINFIPGRTVFVTSEKYRPTNHRPRTALCH